CVHHTFSHSKALATTIIKQSQIKNILTPEALLLPREHAYGVKSFPDINTWLIAKNGWRATVTGYDQEYSMKNGHASGGALSLLWHNDVGLVIAASMNKYQLVENFNMQRDDDPLSMSLTPRFEWQDKDMLYMNISDLDSNVMVKEGNDELLVTATSRLVNENQQPAPVSSTDCELQYRFAAGRFVLRGKCAAVQSNKARFVLPLIATREEKITQVLPNRLLIEKKGGRLIIESNTPMQSLLPVDKRLFNFVPGLEPFPLAFDSAEPEISISVS
ncbi:MAG: hypothetical protein JST39_07850, partial [Bacteroidetes bacterium]|nr:hypothetical protein [Bacteroidota bacterium]